MLIVIFCFVLCHIRGYWKMLNFSIQILAMEIIPKKIRDGKLFSADLCDS